MNRLTAFAFLIVVSVLMPLSYATNVNTHFQTASGGTTDWKFDTDMQFTTGFTLTTANSTVVNNGDMVCSNSTLTITPTVSSIFAASSLDTISGYPSCGGGYCPAMIADGSFNSNRQIKWLSSSVWNDNVNFAVVGGNDFSQDGTRFDGLGGDSSYSTEPVTYTVTPGVYVAGQEGGAGVFCKGTLETLDGGSSLHNADMPSSSAVNFVVGAPGTHTITTRLDNVQCFASVLKHPEERFTHPEYFYFYYFAANQPSIPSTSATSSISINVQNAGGTCSMHETSVSASSSISSSDDILVHVQMHNDGDAILETGVTSSNAGYTVSPFPVGLCNVLGFPPSICPADNGFNESISPGGNKDLYVLVHNNGGASGGTTLTFDAQTVSTSCGGASMCTHDVPLTGPISCAVTPSSLSLGTLEVAQFNVACNDLANNPIACVGDNWTWAGGLTGDFISKSNTGAQAYTSSPPGSHGTLGYQSGIASCASNINVVTPTYECQFVPPSASMNVNATKYFKLNCFQSGVPRVPDNAAYDLITGLTGTTGNGTTNGVDYTAPSSSSSGDLRGFGQFTGAPPPILGAVALATIQVNGGTGNNTNNTNGTGCTDPNGCGNGGPGSTQYCTIGNGPLNVFPGFSGWLPIKCGPAANETCGTGGFNVQWSADPSNSANVNGNNIGVSFNITGAKGTSGTIIAVVNMNGTGCTKPFFIGEPTCAEQS